MPAGLLIVTCIVVAASALLVADPPGSVAAATALRTPGYSITDLGALPGPPGASVSPLRSTRVGT